MEFATAQRYPQEIPHGYFYNDRNMPLAVTNAARPDPRGYPLGGPVGGPRLRGSMGREDGPLEGGQSRRRIAVACARCRKRKIRCSGDPGNGTGCSSCKAAGVEPFACQFHRVGSDYLPRVVDSIHLANHLTSMATPHTVMGAYNTNTPLFPRAVPPANAPVDARAAYATPWTVPGSEDTSTMESYNLDQPAAYLPSQGMYGSSCRWSQASGRPFPEVTAAYVESEPSQLYESNSYPLVQSNVRGTLTESASSLNMGALQLSLPTKPSRTLPMNHMDQFTPQRQLPMPLPSPAQSSRNVVDQLQDQRLRSAQAMGRPHTSHSALPKLGPTFTGDSDGQIAKATTDTTVASLTQGAMPEAVSSAADPSTNYISMAANVNEGAQPPLNFSASSFLDAMQAPSASATYSNFRNYDLPASSSVETMSPLARHDSHTNLYSFMPDSKRSSASTANALISGDQYTPLEEDSSHTQNLNTLQNDKLEARVSTHRASASDLNTTC